MKNNCSITWQIKCIYICISLTSFIVFSGCSSRKTKDLEENCLNTNEQCIKKNKLIDIVTNKGTFVLELNFDFAPITANNFIDLVNRGAYEGTLFHRVVRKPIPFLIQGGDPTFNIYKPINGKLGSGNFFDKKNGQNRFIPLEIKLKNEDKPRYNQIIKNPSRLSDIALKHERGSVSMARSIALNSGSAQFYISLRSIPELDGRYAVFGRVIKGMEILEFIREGDYILKAKETK